MENRIDTDLLGLIKTLPPLLQAPLAERADWNELLEVVLDLGRVFGPASLAKLRRMAAETSGITYLMVAATHTHSGPVIRDAYPDGKVPAWETAAIQKIAGAIEEAKRGAVEARVGTGYGVAYIGHNRRRVNPDGTVTMLWRNETRVPTTPVDATVSVLRLDATDGEPIAVLVNYACHPVVFGPDNLQYSADFPSAMRETVERAFGGKPVSFFPIQPKNTTIIHTRVHGPRACLLNKQTRGIEEHTQTLIQNPAMSN